MAIFKQGVPRRAVAAALLGTLYGLLLLPVPPTIWGIGATGVAWFALSLALLFLRPFAYHAFSIWAMVWVVWKAFENAKAFQGVFPVLLDVGIPAAAFLLLLTSGYLQATRDARTT